MPAAELPDEKIPDLVERLDAALALDPTAPAVGSLVDGDAERWYTFGQLSEFCAAFKRAIGPADDGLRIGVLLRNRPAHLASALAIMLQKHCLVTVNPLQPAAALAEDIADLRLPVLIADEEDWEKPAVAEAARSAGSCGFAIAAAAAGLLLRRRMEESPHDAGRARMPGIAVEMVSSGTTGKPKRIALGRDNLARALWAGSKYEAAGGKLTLKGSPGIQWMPLVHVGGLYGALYSLYNARRFVLMDKFMLETWHDLIRRHRPRFANIPPSSMNALLERNYPKEDFQSLLALRCGAAPLDHDLAVKFEHRYGIPVLEGYGATEFAGGVAGWTIRDHRKYAATKRSSVGRANSGVELRVVDRAIFAPVGVNQEGLLEVRTSQIGDGKAWVRTTDLARIDEDGFLYILGRADDAIIRGGFKVFPATIEAALRQHPQVDEACVVGRPDERVGTVPVSALTLRAGAEAPSAAELNAFLKTRLKPYEIPIEYKILPALPRTPSLKISQSAVRNLFAKGT